MTQRKLRNAVLFFSLSLGVPAGHAQVFQGNASGARSLSMGGSFLGVNDDPYGSMTQNPAGLALLTGSVLDLNLNSLFEYGSFRNAANEDGRNRTGAGVIPYGAFGMPLGSSRFSIGVSASPDALADSSWKYVDAPGGLNHVSYGLQTQKSEIVAIRSAVGFGVYFGPKVSIGMTVGADYNANTLDTPYIFQQQPILAGFKTLLDLQTHGVGWNGSIGVLVHPTRKVQLGAAWKSRTSIVTRGTATGNAANQFAALGVPFQPDFRYRAQVNNTLPQSVSANLICRLNSRLLLTLQEDWVNWNSAFSQLPVFLTAGSNPDINSFVHSKSLNDAIPLHWHDQFTSHFGFETPIGEGVALRGGYSYANDPVPASTLTPLTGVILKNALSTGVGRRWGRYSADLAYAVSLNATGRVGISALQAGEYSNSATRLGLQTVSLSMKALFR